MTSSLSPAELQAAEDAAEVILLRSQLAAARAAAVTVPPLPTIPTILSLTPPLRGGVENGIAWTGGGRRGTIFGLSEPTSPDAFRPTDFRSMNIVHSKCTSGFPEKNCFDTDTTSQVKLVSYMREVKTFLTQTGQEGVFFVKHTGDGVERNILDYSGMYTSADVQHHVTKLRASGDSYDAKNLRTSGILMLTTIGPTLKGEIEKFIHTEDSKTGPYIFMLIIERIVTCSTSTWRALITELGSLSIVNEPGENVEVFADKVTGICCTLEGADQLPKDNAMLVAKSFMYSKVLTFGATFMAIYGQIDDSPNAYQWHTIVLRATKLYRGMVQQKLWTVDMPRVPAGLAGELVVRDGGTSTMTCHSCGVVGHISRNCPKNAGGTGKDPWKTTAPSAGASQTMTKFDKKYFWCGICRHWNLTHTTDKHIAGGGDRGGKARRGTDSAPAKTEEVTPVTSPSAAVSITTAPTQQEGATISSGLVMQGGFMCGFVAEVVTTASDDDYDNMFAHKLDFDERGEFEQRCKKGKWWMDGNNVGYDVPEPPEEPFNTSYDSNDEFDNAVEFMEDMVELTPLTVGDIEEEESIALKD
jgi:hypothetical protein